MKNNIYIQFSGEEISLEKVQQKTKEKWLKLGNKIKDIKSVQTYINIDEQTIYIVINDKEKITIKKEEL